MNPDLTIRDLAKMSADELSASFARAERSAEHRSVLGELIRRGAPEGQVIARALVTDPKRDPKLRSAAAVALSKEATAANEEALLHAIRTDDANLRRHAAASLGRIGTASSIRTLSAIEPASTGATQRAVSFARTLIAYRHGLDLARLSAPDRSRLMDLAPTDAVAIDLTDLPDGAFDDAADNLRRELPALKLSPAGSVRLSCLGQKLWVALTAEVGKLGAVRLTQGSAVAAVVMKQSTCPEDWFIHEYLLCHPVDAARAEAFGVRPSGRLIHYGHVDIEREGGVLTLRALNLAGVPALQLVIAYAAPGKPLSVREALRSGRVNRDAKERIPLSRSGAQH